ncbi:MAG: VWA domain-containing protein [Chlorobi bacterium]|nr:VWA domain-containing protein [Chlorobiota bacterium]
MKRAAFFPLILYSLSLALHAQIPLTNVKPEPQVTRILFVFDCSQSMAGLWESDKKINIARKFLISTIDSLEKMDYVQMALRVFGHQSPVPPQDCNDTKLEVPFSPNNAARIRQKLRFLIPKGTTPIAHSLELSAGDFPPCDNCRNVIILITDGIEACDGDPCAVSQALRKKGIILKPFVIGIGLDMEFKQTYECVGQFYDAANEEQFHEVLDVVITEALNSTTAQVNLLDIHGNPTETNVNMTFYNRESGKIMANYVHTMNNRGNPDTLNLDPLVTYRMVVHTIPPVTVDSIKVYRGKHTVIAADAPQGTLKLTTRGNLYRDLSFIVRKDGDMNTLNMQKINMEEKYLVGKYDLEVPVLPRLLIDDVRIKQSTTTSVEIPQPGLITVLIKNEGFASLYVRKPDDLTWIYNLNHNSRSETIILQPGDYEIVYRPRFAKRSFYTTTRKFSVRSGSSQSIRF